MRVWRICRKAYASTTLDGIGGLYTSGRWHRKGLPIVYTSSSASLAALAVLLHVDPLTAPADLRLISIEIPDDITVEALDPSTLPANWQAVPAPPALQALGESWLISGRSAALIVPSAVIPVERNVMINPQHAETHRISILSEEDFTFDPRLLS